jgi:nitrate/TMAO reductase-like tetraheme cytochrome c subunit
VRSKRGLFLLLVLVGGFGAVAAVGSVMAVRYTETSAFCGRCHTMSPELKAYALSPHREVTCAECHVEPGIKGWVKAKAKGTKQLLEIVTGDYPRPIPAPDHADLPAVTDTCLKCHSLDALTRGGGPVKLVLKARYRADRQNTKETVAVVLRPAGLGQDTTRDVQGVHWHVQKKVTYTSADARSQQIDLVEVAEPDGSTKQYVAGSQVSSAATVAGDLERLRSQERSRTMDCLDCHNRVGHDVPTAGEVVDDALAAGRISPSIPYVKRDAVALLEKAYPSAEAADAAIDAWAPASKVRYRLMSATQGTRLLAAAAELKADYRLVATPGMKASAKTYADNLGHQTAPGCFRCHDGAHFLVDKGKVTSTPIPSGCATCHTFPQIGGRVTGVLVGGQPKNHDAKGFVFSHRDLATSLDPAGTSCGTCHVRSYCENCHSSGAVNVRHDQMLYSHPKAVLQSSLSTCAYCHQQSYCATCHKDLVLDAKPP